VIPNANIIKRPLYRSQVLLIFFTELKTVFNDRHTHRKTFTDFSYFRYLIDISASIEIIIILNTFQKGEGQKMYGHRIGEDEQDL